MNWQGDERFTFKDVDQADKLRHYFDFNPARGDFRFVAEVDGLVIGVVWLLFFDARNKGYGFVAEWVPELSISVRSGYRGQGVGEKLMRLVVNEAQSQNLSRVSLRVETGNPAISLYRKFGFTPARRIAEGTFVLKIQRCPAQGSTCGHSFKGKSRTPGLHSLHGDHSAVPRLRCRSS